MTVNVGSSGPDLAYAWAQLDATSRPGRHSIRLDPAINLTATIENPSRSIGLELTIPESVTLDPDELAGSTEVAVTYSSDGTTTTLALTLRTEDHRDMFLRMCDDIVPRTLSHRTARAALIALLRRFNAWQRFFKRSGAGLSPERQRGLWGELQTLQDLIVPALNVDAVSVWTGPSQAPQDFQTKGIAVEVKTIVHSQPQRLRIDGERQLDDIGLDALVIAHHRIVEHRDSGRSLPAQVRGAREAIASSGGDLEEFDNKLLEVGYADVDEGLYGVTGYTLRETHYYKVGQGFPRVTETDLLPGIGSLRYVVDASACERFMIDRETVLAWLTQPPAVGSPEDTPESLTVEYKQSAWTPTEAGSNPEHYRALTAAVSTEVVKTVVAFLNSVGGELVVGVADSPRQVTGIEHELLKMGARADDFDLYERKLLTLIATNVDSRAPSQVRVRFERHELGTTCHVAVRPSPTPRFGKPITGPGETTRVAFWIRAGNQSRSLEGPEMLAYIAEHWI